MIVVFIFLIALFVSCLIIMEIKISKLESTIKRNENYIFYYDQLLNTINTRKREYHMQEIKRIESVYMESIRDIKYKHSKHIMEVLNTPEVSTYVEREIKRRTK